MAAGFAHGARVGDADGRAIRMGYLLEIALALMVLGASEAIGLIGGELPLALFALALVPHLLALVARRAFLRGRFRQSFVVLRALQFSPVALFFVALAVLGWRETVSRIVGHDVSFFAWPELGVLLLGAPFVVFEALAIDARARVVCGTSHERRASRKFHHRMFAASLAPVVAYAVLASVVGWSESLRTHIEEVRIYGALFGAVLLAGMTLALPYMLRRTWDTTPIPEGSQRELLLEVARLANFRSRALLVWNTGSMMANAAIIGVGGANRVVLFSDALLEQLDLRELAAVFAHEIGHAFRRHVLLFALWALALFLGADLLAQIWFPDGTWSAAGVVLAALIVWALTFSYVSRRCELDADLFSMELLRDWTALASALERVGGRLRDVASWRHFSVADRVRFLERAALDPAVGRKLRRGIRAWTWIGSIALAAVLFGHALRMARGFRAEQIVVDLRLGRYAAAVTSAADAGDVDPALLALVERAAPLRASERGGRSASTDEIEARARAALRAGDAMAAAEWLALGTLRGRSDLGLVGEVVQAWMETGELSDASLPEEIAAGWAAEIGSLTGRPGPHSSGR